LAATFLKVTLGGARRIIETPGRDEGARMTTNPSGYRRDIDGLRAIAVLSVVGFHAFPDWMPGGYIGVDVFFVISGFLITGMIRANQDEGRFRFRSFYARRIRRIFPALVLVLTVVYAIGWFVCLPKELEQLGKHTLGGATFVSNFVLWRESGYFTNAAETKPLLHLWSLGIEEQFYIVWPLFLYATSKLRADVRLFIGGVLAASLAANATIVTSDVVAAFYSPWTRFWELMIGSLLTGRAPTGRNAQSIAGLMMIAASVAVLDKSSLFPGAWALLPTLGTALIIIAGPEAWLNREVLSQPILVWFGLISYPLYLWHWPLLSFANIIESSAPSATLRLATVAVSIALAWLTYALVEKRIRFGPPSRAKVTGLVASMAVIGLVGLHALLREGVRSRFPEMISGLDQFSYDYRSEYREGSCFLRPEQASSELLECIEGAPSLPSVLIWGDSHAAQLYPGLRREWRDLRLVQLTASRCPPMLDIDITNAPHCREVNDEIYRRVSEQAPDLIILSADWASYDWPRLERMKWSPLAGTVERLKRSGVKRVEIVGPFPHWRDGLPRCLFRFFTHDSVLHRIPERMNLGLEDMSGLDRALARFSASAGVEYISPLGVFCDPDGCLTRIGADLESLTAWDEAHLTVAGSAYFASKLGR
jgi:peptidoglycan/LPS O-acetylase OafA/YrhL